MRLAKGLFVPDYADATLSADFTWWCEHQLVQTVDQFAGRPLKLEPWQRSFFSDALALDADEAPYWKLVVLEVARKNGKTAMLAAYALYHLLETTGSPEVLLAASSDKQAGRLYDAAVSYCRATEQLDELVHLREYVGEIARKDGLGKIIRMASDPGRAHGYNPSLVLADELHAWTTPSLGRAWGAFTTGGGARAAAQIFSITVAGEAQQRASGILGRLLDANKAAGEVEEIGPLTISRNHVARTLVYAYEAKTLDRRDVKALKRANPASWITEKYLREQGENPALRDDEMLQLHGCVWAAGETTFVAPDVLSRALEAGADRRLVDGETIVLGFDGSETRDETWLVAATLDGYVEPIARWARPAGAPPDWRIPRREVHAAIDLAMDRYDVLELAADGPGWYSEIDHWEELYGERIVVFETRQPSKMAPACERTQAMLLSGQLAIGGPLSQDLRRHFANCNVRQTPYGTVVTKDHDDSPRKIDGAVATMIAEDRATWHASRPEPTYKVGGFR